MGYRSEVALALTSDAARVLKALYDHNLKLKAFIDDADSLENFNDSAIEDGYTTKILWGGIKWYEGYNEIDMIQTFLNNTDDMEWYFIRIGEECDDIVTEGGFYESDMYVSRHIEL